MRIDLFDVVRRAVAVPAIIWSASAALLGVRRADEPLGSRVARLSDGFFEHVEERFQTRWAELFPADDELDRAA